MHIIGSQLQQSVSYQYQRQETRITAQVIQDAPAERTDTNTIRQPNENANLRAFEHPPMQHGLNKQQVSDVEKGNQSGLAEEIEELTADFQLRLMALILEKLTGRAIEWMDSRELSNDNDSEEVTDALATTTAEPPQKQQDTPQQLTISLVSVNESESLSYQAAGGVKTADGREINFSFNMEMSRSYSAMSLTATSGQPDDPLLLVLPWSKPELAPAEEDEQQDIAIPKTSPGSGYLVLDKNGDGEFSGKEELIGGLTGNAFAELAAMDEDGNGFIDEGDKAFFDIMFYEPDKPLESLLKVGVGALSLSATETPYHYKKNDDTYAEMVASSFALMENGGVAGLHQVDLYS